MVQALYKNGKISRKGPVVLVIMDGVGFGAYQEGDAVADSKTMMLKQLLKTAPWTKLKAHGRLSVFPLMKTWVTVRSVTMQWAAEEYSPKERNLSTTQLRPGLCSKVRYGKSSSTT